jgi:hypothetical protein
VIPTQKADIVIDREEFMIKTTLVLAISRLVIAGATPSINEPDVDVG